MIKGAVAERAASNPWHQWWAVSAESMLREMPGLAGLAGLRRQFVEGFTAAMSAAGMDRFDAAGIAATWWEDGVHELQTAVSRGYKAVIEAWLTTAEASRDDKNAPEVADQIAVKLLAGSSLAERAALAAALAGLDSEIRATETDGDDEDDPDDTPEPLDVKKLKSERTKVKKSLKSIDASLLETARQSLAAMSDADAPDEVIGVFQTRIEALVIAYFADIERTALAWYDNLVVKYGTSLRDLESQRDTAAARLDTHLKELGYG